MQAMDGGAAAPAPPADDRRQVPTLAWLLGLAGLIPFLATGVLALNPQPSVALPGLLALTGYGAVILSFLGAVHWGIALQAPTGFPAPQTPRLQRARLVLSVVPSLIGWVALLLPQAYLPAWAGLPLLIAGFAATAAAEARAARQGLLPRGYMPLRWLLTALVVIILVGVLFLRLIGAYLSW